MNQQALSYLIPQMWMRLRFHAAELFMSLLNEVSCTLWTDKSCSIARQERCERSWTEMSLPKHFNLWQLYIGDFRPPGISNNAPLFYLHFSLLVFSFFPLPLSLPPSSAHQMCLWREMPSACHVHSVMSPYSLCTSDIITKAITGLW